MNAGLSASDSALASETANVSPALAAISSSSCATLFTPASQTNCRGAIHAASSPQPSMASSSTVAAPSRRVRLSESIQKTGPADDSRPATVS